MCVTTLIATNQIVVLNFSLRSPNTHIMSYTIKHVSQSCAVESKCVRLRVFLCELLRFLPPLQLFLEMVPRFLGMSPLVDDSEVTSGVNGLRERRRSSFGLMQRAEEYVLKQPRSEMMFDKQRERHGLTRSIGEKNLTIVIQILFSTFIQVCNTFLFLSSHCQFEIVTFRILRYRSKSNPKGSTMFKTG